MATSTLMGSEGGTEQQQRGNKKKGNNENNKAKKKPRRGMGVEKLEMLRLQAEGINVDSSSLTQPRAQAQGPPLQPINLMNQYFVPCNYSGFASSAYVPPVINGGLSLAGPVGPVSGSGGGGGAFTGYGAGFGETSRELSSIPNSNLFSGYQWAGFSTKKKRLDGESLGCNGFGGNEAQFNGCDFLGINNLGKNQLTEEKTQEFRVKSPSLASYVGGNTDQEAEVVAVHRKGSSKLVMEYDFFPGSEKSTHPQAEEEEFLSVATSAPPSPSQAPPPPTAAAAFNASNSIDLSLKLSI